MRVEHKIGNYIGAKIAGINLNMIYVWKMNEFGN